MQLTVIMYNIAMDKLSGIRLKPYEASFAETIKDIYKAGNPSKMNPLRTHTIYRGKNPVGIIGFKPYEGEPPSGFVAIHEKYRGQNVLPRAYDKLMKKHDFDAIRASIAHSNKASMKSHKGAGFKELSENEYQKLRERGRLGIATEGTRLEKRSSLLIQLSKIIK